MSSSSASDRIRKAGEAGFTLLEVLIAMAILVFISFGIYQATTETYRVRDILLNEGDFYNGIRLSMDIVNRDVALLYSPTIMVPPKPQALDAAGNPIPGSPADARDMQAILSSELGQASRFWSPAVDKTGIRPSRFVGTDSAMSFVSASHLRIYKDSPESDLAKISYELRRDEAASDTYTLFKIESTNVFDDDESRDKSFQRTFPILPGVTRLRFRYYRKDKDQWLNGWDSDREDTKNIYPDMIEVTLTVTGPPGPARLNFDGMYRFRPEVPLHGLDPST